MRKKVNLDRVIATILLFRHDLQQIINHFPQDAEMKLKSLEEKLTVYLTFMSEGKLEK